MCVLINSCCSRNAHTSRLYLKNSNLKISTQDIAKPFLVARNSTMPHWFRSFIWLSGVRVVWYAKCSGAEGGVSCCLFSRRRSEVALDFKECFQTKLGFFSQEHFAQCSLCHPHLLYPPNTWKPSLLITLLLLSYQQLLPSTEIFPLSLRSCASFQISGPDVLFFPYLHIQVWYLFASLLENRNAEHGEYFFHLLLSHFHRYAQFTVQAQEIHSCQSPRSLAKKEPSGGLCSQN